MVSIILAIFGVAGAILFYHLYQLGGTLTEDGPCVEDSFLGDEPSEADFSNP